MPSLRLPAAAPSKQSLRAVSHALLACSLLALLPDSAAACTCMQPAPYAERRLEYQSVFHGKVAATAWDDARQLRWIRFDVIKDFSAEASVDDTLTVWTTQDGAACGVDYPVGEEVLVFADTGNYLPTKPAGSMVTHLCSGNPWGPNLEPALQAMESALGVHPGRLQPAVRRERARFDCGQVLFEGRVQANGVLRNGPGNR